MKKLPILLGALVVIVAVIVVSFSPGKVYSASVGTELDNPESGWTRIETSEGTSLDPNFVYSSGSGWYAGNVGNSSPNEWTGGSTAVTSNSGDSVTFSFTGTQLRIIGILASSNYLSNSISVIIDNTSQTPFTEVGTPGAFPTLVYDSGPLSSGSHSVTLTNNVSGVQFIFDAIDVLNSASPTPSPTPAATASPAPSPELCYDYAIVGTLGTANPGTIPGNGSTIISPPYTVTGAQMGDFVQVSFDQDLQGVNVFGYVSAANQVTVVFQNGTGSNVALSSGTVRVHVYRHTHC